MSKWYNQCFDDHWARCRNSFCREEFLAERVKRKRKCPKCGINNRLEIPLSKREKKKDLYQELLYAVVRKFPGETRHETALRYIREAEAISGEASAQEEKEGSDG